ncbi:putative structural protein [Scale drop disease virus]
MLPIQVIWNNIHEVAHLFPMQTYDQFITHLARLHRSHRDFINVSAKNMQELLEATTVTVTDYLPTVVRQTDMTVPNLSHLPDDVRTLLAEVFIVTHVSALDPYFQITMEDARVVRDVRDVIGRGYAITDQLNQMTQIVQLDLVRTDVPFLQFTPIEYVREHLHITLDFPQQYESIYNLFDQIKPSKYTPHIQTDKFFKTRFNFIPSKKWIETKTADNTIVVKYNPETVGVRQLNDPYQTYYEAEIYRDGLAKIDIPVGHRYVNKQTCIERAFNGFTLKQHRQHLLICTSSIRTNNLYDPMTFTDFIMNDKYTSRTFSINESNIAHRQRPIVYITFNDTKQLIGLSLIKDIINLKFKVVNQTTLDFLFQCLSIMWHRYSTYRQECITFYKRYGIDPVSTLLIESNAPLTDASGGTLRDYEPDVFIPKYSRHCLHLPRVVNDHEAREIRDSYGEEYVMEWPLYGETTKRFYACTHNPNEPFPGVRPNALATNKDKYPFVPCCFKVNQYTKKTGGLTKYMKGVIQHQQIESPIVVEEQVTAVPDNIKQLLGPDITLQSVDQSHVSFFHCLNIPMGRVMEIINTPDHPAIIACYQELYTLMPKFDDTIVDEFISVDCKGVLMGEFFYRIAEYILDMPVYLFDRTGFIIPPHRLVHLKFTPEQQYALCVYNDGKNQYSLITNVSYTASEIHDMFIDACNQFENGKPMARIPYIKTVNAQQIDRYGKCRRVRLTDGTIQHVKPCPPYPVPLFVTGDEYVTNRHPVIQLDYNERDFRDLYGRLKKLYSESNLKDVDAFAALSMRQDNTDSVIRNNIFYSPYVDKFIDKLKLEQQNNTLDVNRDTTYTTPNDFMMDDSYTVWSTDNFPNLFDPELNVALSFDADNDEPYLYAVSHDQVCLFQNCNNSIALAAYVCDVWRHKKYNCFKDSAVPDVASRETTNPDYILINGKLLHYNGRIVVTNQFDTGVVELKPNVYAALMKI